MAENRKNSPGREKVTRNTIDYNKMVNRSDDSYGANRRRKISVPENVARSEKITANRRRANAYGTRTVDRSYYEKGRNNRTNPIRHEAVQQQRKNGIEEKMKRIELEKKRERMRIQSIKAAIFLLLASAVMVMLLFMTPLFNIREIKLEGNNVVTKEMIEEKIGYMVGANLFSTRKSVIRENMFDIAQISDVTVDKTLFPPSITVTVHESSPAAYFLSGNTIVVINSELKVIDDSNEFETENIPSLSGISIQRYQLNKTVKTESDEKDNILRLMLEAFESSGLLNEVTYIGLDDISNIKFNYANRIEVMCGSQLELERKIRMFKEAINSDSVSSNAIGTVDLSVPGQAVYTP